LAASNGDAIQAMCSAGAIDLYGDKLLTTGNPDTKPT
jgi:hypothetical protein